MGGRALVARRPCLSAHTGNVTLARWARSWRGLPSPSLPLGEYSWYQGPAVSCGHRRLLQSILTHNKSALFQPRWNHMVPSCKLLNDTHSSYDQGQDA